MKNTALMGLVTVVIACSACGEKKSDSAAPPAATPGVTTAAAAGTGDKGAATAAPTAAPAGTAAPTGDGGLKSMFAGPAEAGTKDSETVYQAGGVVLGFPAGWKSGNAKEVDDESVTMVGTAFTAPLVNATLRGAEIFCNAMSIDFSQGSVEFGAKHANFQKIKWTEEVEGTVGDGGFKAKLGKGTGEQISGTHQPVVAYYVYTTVAGAAKPVLCVAAYPASHPELEKDIVLAWKGMKLKK